MGCLRHLVYVETVIKSKYVPIFHLIKFVLAFADGHPEQLYEQSRFANETGAAVHLAPNSNGVLRRWGIFAEEFGAVESKRIVERHFSGQTIKDVDGTVPNKQWQHPWLLSHRVNLHEKLKALVTAEKGAGPPAKLHTSSKIVNLDSEKGWVELADGTTVQGDVVLGADGIYVRLRIVFFLNPFQSEADA